MTIALANPGTSFPSVIPTLDFSVTLKNKQNFIGLDLLRKMIKANIF